MPNNLPKCDKLDLQLMRVGQVLEMGWKLKRAKVDRVAKAIKS